MYSLELERRWLQQGFKPCCCLNLTARRLVQTQLVNSVTQAWTHMQEILIKRRDLDQNGMFVLPAASEVPAVNDTTASELILV